MSAVVWYLDRGAALVAYPALYLATLTGVFYNTPAFGSLHDVARRVHVETATFATLVTLLHAALGVADTWLVVTGRAPAPSYSTTYLLAGVVVGGGALFLVVVAVWGFVEPARFAPPWGPRAVHAFAYAGFAFATVHAAAVGTDVLGLVRPVVIPSLAVLVSVLLARVVVRRRATAAAAQ